MSISFDEAKGLLTLETLSTSYQMKIDRAGYLEHLYYGPRIDGADMSYMLRHYDRGFSGNPYAERHDRTFSLDTLGQEYSSFGVGDYRVHSIGAVSPDGSRCVEFRYVSHEIRPGKYALPGLPAAYDNGGEAESLIVTLRDGVTGLGLRLYYGVFEKLDVITRAAEIFSDGDSAFVLEKAASVCLDLPFGNWDLINFHGRHCMERQPERCPLNHGTRVIGSERGMSSHHQNPFVILCDRDATEDHGVCCGMMLAYSGSFKAEIQMDQCGSVRAVMGVSDTQFRWQLNPGESFFTPEALLACADGLARLSQTYHRLIRQNICRGEYKNKPRPVLLNSWEACYFDLSEDKILSLAKEAAALGVELFVLDDGWFKSRRDDNAGLGDWVVDREKLPNGLGGLIGQINALGLEFGIWVEPEMVNEDSDLFRAHPDWALRAPSRPPMMARNQLVLDMSRADVREYLYQALSTLFRENNIRYVKWDFNRPVSDLYSAQLDASRQGELGHRYVLGVYSLLDRLTTEFPHILFEGCAGGGGRFDAGMLYYEPQIWCSDDTDAIERLEIQSGSSYGYPVCTMGAHVSAVPNHQTGRTTPLRTRGVVAMSGAFGYELDPAKLTEEEKQEIRRQIAQFHADEALIHGGLCFRLTDAAKDRVCVAWQFASPDGTKALLSAVIRHPQANAPLVHLHLKGLNPDERYRAVEDGSILSGAALMRGGYTLPQLMGDYPAFQLHLEQIDEA